MSRNEKIETKFNWFNFFKIKHSNLNFSSVLHCCGCSFTGYVVSRLYFATVSQTTAHRNIDWFWSLDWCLYGRTFANISMFWNEKSCYQINQESPQNWIKTDGSSFYGVNARLLRTNHWYRFKREPLSYWKS